MLNSKNAIIIIGGRLPLFLSEDRFNNEEGGDEGDLKYVLQYPGRKLGEHKARKAAIFKEYRKTITELAEHGHKVILVYPVPEAGWHVPKRFLKLLRNKNAQQIKKYLSANPLSTSYEVFRARVKDSFALLDHLQHPNIFRVYPHKLFCNTTLPGRCITHDLENSFYRDSNHLSIKGAELLIDKIIENRAFAN